MFFYLFCFYKKPLSWLLQVSHISSVRFFEKKNVQIADATINGLYKIFVCGFLVVFVRGNFDGILEIVRDVNLYKNISAMNLLSVIVLYTYFG